MKQIVSIKAISSVSPLGSSPVESWNAYIDNKHFLDTISIAGSDIWCGAVNGNIKAELSRLRSANSKYQYLDESVLLAIITARQATQMAAWEEDESIGINIGSSRGATGLFEEYHEQFIRTQQTPALTSPTTTMGNISSWVAHDLQTSGPVISHSITCSTSLHAMLNAMAWIRSGMASKFIVGGSEAPLTPFTLSQMQALRIYADSPLDSSETGYYPCRALDLDKKYNSMILGEGASIACMEAGITENSLAVIEGAGYATEILDHSVSLSSSARCLQDSMLMALGMVPVHEVDVVVLHAPGTIKGDTAEYRAIEKVFGSNLPALTNNKWKIGHCLGASGMLSIDLAVQMLQQQEFIDIPYLQNQKRPDKLERILVNSVGFGGNAVSILLKRNN